MDPQSPTSSQEMEIDDHSPPSLDMASCRTPVEGLALVELDPDLLKLKGLHISEENLVSEGSHPTMQSKIDDNKVRRKLFVRPEEVKPEAKAQSVWTQEEIKSLVLFVALHCDGHTWMTHKDFRFWDEAGAFIQLHLHTPLKRSGGI